MGISKRNREFFKDGIYHIIMRGHNRSFIYEAMADKAFFLEVLQSCAKEFQIVVLYYVLMDNHYHLLVRLDSECLSQFMQRLNYLYSKYYNKKYNRSGTVYGGRFAHFLVKDTRYLLQLILYMAYNPVKARIVKMPSLYRWSAHLELVNEKDGGVVSRGILYRLLGTDYSEGERLYTQLFETPDLTMMAWDYQDSSEIHEFYESRKLEQFLAQLVCWAGSDTLYSKLLSGRGGQQNVALRKRCIIEGIEAGYDVAVVAEGLGVSRRRVNQVIAARRDVGN